MTMAECGMRFNACEELKRLKESAICDYQNLLFHALRGHYYDYQLILEKISLIDIYERVSEDLNDMDYYITYYNSAKWQPKKLY